MKENTILNEDGEAACGVASKALAAPGTAKGMHEEFKKIAKETIDNVGLTLIYFGNV